MVLCRSATLCKQGRSCRVIAWFSVFLLLSANKRGVVGLLHGSLSFSANKRGVVGLLHGSLSFSANKRCCRVITWFSVVLLLSANKSGIFGLLHGSLSLLGTREEL